jgi:hypothetical protein
MRSALLDVVVVVAVAPRSPPSPIPGIRQTRTPDTPVDVFVVTAVVDVALSPPLPSAVVAVFDREKARRGRPNANDSAGREREASALAIRDGGGGRGGHRHGRPPPPWLSSSSSSSTVVQRRCHCRRRRPRHGPPVHRAPPPIAITVVVDCYLVPLPSPPSTDQWRPNKGGGDCEIKAKN